MNDLHQAAKKHLKALGQNIGQGLAQGMENYAASREKRKHKKFMEKERQKNLKKLALLLENYDPAVNCEFVIKILESDLPDSMNLS